MLKCCTYSRSTLSRWRGPRDQHVVEAFPAQRPDEAFRDRIRTRCPDRGADDPHVGAGEDGVASAANATNAGADHERHDPVNVHGQRTAITVG